MNRLYLFLGLLLTPGVTYATNPFRQYCNQIHGGCSSGSGFLVALGIKMVHLISVLIAGGAVIVIIYGGIKLMTSAGNEQGKEDAKKILGYAIAGLIFALAGEAIIFFVNSFMVQVGMN